MEQLQTGKGERKNDNKARYDLIEPFAQLQKAQIFTKGAKKYAPNNWLQGMAWSKCYASALRHMAAWSRGEDYDIDANCSECQKSIKSGEWTCLNHTGELHSALAAWNWDAITSYYKHFPQGDDRIHHILPVRRIGLDIDDVICSWVSTWCKKFKLDIPSCWQFQWNLQEEFERMKNSGELDQFYLDLPVNENPDNIPFVPVCYITHRPVSREITEQWLLKHGFPLSPVFSVKSRDEKIEVAKSMKLDVFVDDNFDTFKHFNQNGICCYLYTAKHNQRHDVGYRRIKRLNELKQW
jgi:uncharacterized HAD superfamily protein